jgi:hypothetical protein
MSEKFAAYHRNIHTTEKETQIVYSATERARPWS